MTSFNASFMSDPTAEKSDIQVKREELMAAYLKGEKAKMNKIAADSQPPSPKQKFYNDVKKSLRGVIEAF